MKKMVLLAIACMVGSHAFSQRFFHSLGFPVFVDHSLSKSIVSFGLTYAIRYNVMETEKMSLSIGMPISYGGSGHGPGKKEEWYYDSEGNYVSYYTDEEKEGPFTKERTMVDIPLVIQFNFGALSTAANKNRLGFFAGGGLGYHYGPVNVKYPDRSGNTYTDSTTQHSVGPMGNIGFRVALGKERTGAIELKLSYMKSVARRTADIYGISLQYTFFVPRKRS